MPFSGVEIFKSHSAEGITNEIHSISIASLAFAKAHMINSIRWNLPKPDKKAAINSLKKEHIDSNECLPIIDKAFS